MKKILMIIFFFLFVSNIYAKEVVNIEIYDKKIKNLSLENNKLKELLENIRFKYDKKIDSLNNVINDLNNKINEQNKSLSYLSNVNNDNVNTYKNKLNKLQILLNEKKKENIELNDELSACLDKDEVIYKKDNRKTIYSFMIVTILILIIIKKM